MYIFLPTPSPRGRVNVNHTHCSCSFPPSSCVPTGLAAASIPTYLVNRCGTHLIFGGRSSRSAHPLLRALCPLSCDAARAMARLRQACSCPLAFGAPRRLLEASSGGGGGGWRRLGLGHGLPSASPASPSLALPTEPLGPPLCTCLPVDQGGRGEGRLEQWQ